MKYYYINMKCYRYNITMFIKLMENIFHYYENNITKNRINFIKQNRYNCIIIIKDFFITWMCFVRFTSINCKREKLSKWHAKE